MSFLVTEDESLVTTEKSPKRSRSAGRTTIISGSSNIFTARRSSSSSVTRNDLSRDMHTSTPLPGNSPDTSRDRRKNRGSKTRPRSSSVEAKKKSRRSDSQNRGKPEPPTCLDVERSMGRGTLKLRWLPPRMDLMSRSNGQSIIGYEVRLNGVRVSQVSGANVGQAIVQNADLSEDMVIHVCSIGANGSTSKPAEVKRKADKDNRNASDKNETIKKKKATVLYDYNPREDSPYSDPDKEIHLVQGQVVSIVRSERSDGFCKVKTGQNSGWVPSSFLIETN